MVCILYVESKPLTFLQEHYWGFVVMRMFWTQKVQHHAPSYVDSLLIPSEKFVINTFSNLH